MSKQLTNPMEVLLTSKEAAKYLGKSEPFLRWMRNQGQGPSYLKLDGWSIRYRLEDLDAYLSDQDAEAAKRVV